MAWTDRQQAMLAEMGLRLWLPPAALPTDAPAGTLAPPSTSAPQGPAASAPPGPNTSAPPGPATSAPPGPATAPMPSAAADGAAVPIQRRPAPIPTAHATTDALGAPVSHDGVATLDWPALRAAVAGCQACGLCATRRQTVFGVGHPQARLMVVGEAPGEQEDAQGEPFVGAAGQLLDRMLAAIGQGRTDAPPERQVFIANTLKCRPPRNRNPAPEELAACQPFLERQVALVQPRVILAMGRFAVTQLLGSDAPIGRLRGTVHRWRGVPLVVSYHPAYLLRQPADKAKAWDDLCLAQALLQE